MNTELTKDKQGMNGKTTYQTFTSLAETMQLANATTLLHMHFNSIQNYRLLRSHLSKRKTKSH